MAIYRTERALVLFGVESVWGTRVTPSMRFGIHEVVTAPDMENEWYGFFGIGSGRSRDTILRGRLALRGSVPDIRLQSTGAALRSLLALPLGHVSGTTVYEGKNATGGDATPYDERLNSMTMSIAMQDTDGGHFVREFYGGKVNRATYSAAEGEELRLSLEEILFKDMMHNRSAAKSGAGSGVDPGASGSPRYIFAGATIQAMGVTLCKVRRFALTVDNQLEPKYYLCKASGDPSHLTQIPNDLMEGKRVYTLDLELDLTDPATDLELFDAMMDQGAAGSSGPTIGMLVTAAFQTSEGSSSTLTISCSVGSSSIHPATVIRSGKISIPAPPMGYFPTTYTMDVDHVRIAVP